MFRKLFLNDVRYLDSIRLHWRGESLALVFTRLFPEFFRFFFALWERPKSNRSTSPFVCRRYRILLNIFSLRPKSENRKLPSRTNHHINVKVTSNDIILMTILWRWYQNVSFTSNDFVFLSGPRTKTCKIPAGKSYIFYSLPMLSWYPEKRTPCSCCSRDIKRQRWRIENENL